MNGYTKPDWSQATLLTIDVQNDFTLRDAPAEIEGTMELVPRMQRLVEAFRETSSPIVHAVRLYQEDGSNVDLCRRQHIEDGAEIVEPGTEGAELVDELKPGGTVSADSERLLDGEFQEISEDEYLMYKSRWSAFYETGLDDFLEDHSVNTVVVCGCNFPNCPRTTIYDASQRDYRIVSAADATSGTYERGLKELSQIGVAIQDTDAIIEQL